MHRKASDERIWFFICIAKILFLFCPPLLIHWHYLSPSREKQTLKSDKQKWLFYPGQTIIIILFPTIAKISMHQHATTQTHSDVSFPAYVFARKINADKQVEEKELRTEELVSNWIYPYMFNKCIEFSCSKERMDIHRTDVSPCNLPLHF